MGGGLWREGRGRGRPGSGWPGWNEAVAMDTAMEESPFAAAAVFQRTQTTPRDI